MLEGPPSPQFVAAARKREEEGTDSYNKLARALYQNNIHHGQEKPKPAPQKTPTRAVDIDSNPYPNRGVVSVLRVRARGNRTPYIRSPRLPKSPRRTETVERTGLLPPRPVSTSLCTRSARTMSLPWPRSPHPNTPLLVDWLSIYLKAFLHCCVCVYIYIEYYVSRLTDNSQLHTLSSCHNTKIIGWQSSLSFPPRARPKSKSRSRPTSSFKDRSQRVSSKI